MLRRYWLAALFLVGSASPLLAGQPVSEKGKPVDPQVSVEIRIVTMPHASALKCCALAGIDDPAGMAHTCRSNDTHKPVVAGMMDVAASSENTKGHSCCADCSSFLSAQQLAHLLHAAQEDANTCVMQTPRMTIGNGQSAELCQKEDHFFVTSLSVHQIGGQQVYIPCNNLVDSGFKVAVRPTVSADQRSVQLELNGRFSFIQSVALFPVTTFITPVAEGHVVGQPVPFTQYIQQPKVVTVAADHKAVLPDGGTVVLARWRTMRDFEEENETPILCDLPYLGDLFKSKVNRQEEMDVVVLVTPRIICDIQAKHVAANIVPSIMPVLHIEEEEEAFVAHECCDKAAKATESSAPLLPPAPIQGITTTIRETQTGSMIFGVGVNSDAGLTGSMVVDGELQRCSAEVGVSYSTAKVAWLMAQYEIACAKGESAEATKLAVQALAIDPTCFSKAHVAQQPK